jgi:ECF transporter S component (folate family)
MNATVRKITTIGMLLALQVVAGHFFTIHLQTVKIGFTFLPLIITAILYGPMWGAVSALLGDFLISMLSPYGYYPPLALTAMLSGLLYGLFLYRKPASTWRVSLCIIAQSVLCSLLLNTFFLTQLYGYGFLALLPSRVIQNLVTIPVQILCTRLVAYRVAGLMPRSLTAA